MIFLFPRHASYFLLTFFFLFPLCSLSNTLIFTVKVQAISKHARTLDEWFYGDYGSGLGAPLPRSGPNLSTWAI